MKKALSFVLMFVMLATMSISIFAADFVPSIEAKSGLEVGTFEVKTEVKDEKGEVQEVTKTYIAIIFETETEEVVDGAVGADQASTAAADELIFYVTPYAEREESVIPEIKKALEDTVEQLKAVDNVTELGNGSMAEKITEIIDNFNKETAANIEESKLVVSDVFDASLVLNNESIHKLALGQKCSFMIKPTNTNIGKDDFFLLLHNTEDDKWEVVENVEWVTVDGEDYLKATIDHLSTFVLTVENRNLVEPQEPQEPERGGFWWWWILLLILICIAVATYFYWRSKKKAKNAEKNKNEQK